MEALVALGLLALNLFGIAKVTTRENYFKPQELSPDKTVSKKP